MAHAHPHGTHGHGHGPGGHGHGPGADPYTLDWGEQAPRLAAHAASEQGWYATIAEDLVRPDDRVAVDVGCGGAGMTAALAAALPADALVVAADHSQAVLDAARERLAALEDLRARVEYVVADLDHGSEALPRDANLVWASASVHHSGDQQAAVDALAGLLAPGGRLALAEGGLRPRHLPWDLGIGEPGLETRLEAAQEVWFARMRAALPNSTRMGYGWPVALSRAGLADVTMKTVLLERAVPLSDADRAHVIAWLAQRIEWMKPADLLSDDDLATWTTLLDPENPQWLGHREDLYSIEARTVHIGHKP